MNNKIGVYYLIHEDKVVYIGRSKNVDNRVSSHKRKNDIVFDSFKFIECDLNNIEDMERDEIQKHKPIHNKKMNPDWIADNYSLLKKTGVNDKIIDLLNEKHKTVYGLGKHLGISPQSTHQIVKKGKLSDQYYRMRKIADFLECDIEDIID